MNCTTPRRGMTLLDLVACLGLLALVAGAAMPPLVQQWERANRIECATNLRQMGQAMRQYAIDDVRGGNYPRTIYNPQAEPIWATPYEGSDLGPRAGVNPFLTQNPARPLPRQEKELLRYTPETNDITAAMFHLFRKADLASSVFTCPSTLATPWQGEEGAGKASYTNWPGEEALMNHVSYSFQNMYYSPDAIGRGAKWTDSLNSTYILVADMNPGGEAVLEVDGQSGADAIRKANSYNHFRDGQNVLMADGAVRFATTPLAGPTGDNIYTFRDRGRGEGVTELNIPGAGIVGSSYDVQDNILLPTAEVLKVEERPLPTEAEVEEAVQQQQEQEARAQLEAMLQNVEVGLGRIEHLNRAADQLPRQIAATLENAENQLRTNARAATELAAAARTKGDSAVAERAETAAREAEAAADRMAALRLTAESAAPATRPIGPTTRPR